MTHRTTTAAVPPPAPQTASGLQQFIATPDEKQLIDIHAWALSKALSASTDSCSASDSSDSSDSCDLSDASSASDSYERLRLLVRLRDEAGGVIYFADGHSYAKDALECEFPEFKLFDIRLEEAFTESVCPGVWIETPHFAALRSLSAMRREIRRTGLHPGAEAVDVMRVLLGL